VKEDKINESHRQSNAKRHKKKWKMPGKGDREAEIVKIEITPKVDVEKIRENGEEGVEE